MSEYAAYVGWDWADQEHQICLREAGSGTCRQQKLKATPEALHGWAAQMLQRFGGRRIALGIEAARGAVIWALMAYEHIVLYPINPSAAARFREALYPSGKKDDPVDAEMLCEMTTKHWEKLRAFAPADAQTRELSLLSEGRRKLVNDRTRLTNRLIANLKAYYPQALELAGKLDTPMACAFPRRWPTFTSGGSKGSKTVLRRVRRSKFVHQTVVEWAAHFCQFSDWGRAYYARESARGRTRWAILRSLGFKLLRIVFRCWQSHTPYSEETYQRALLTHGSPLAKELAA